MTGEPQSLHNVGVLHKPEIQQDASHASADCDQFHPLRSTRGGSVVIVETSNTRSCKTRLWRRWCASARGMPEAAALKIAAAPGSRIGRLSRTQAVNSSSPWRKREHCCSSSRYPVRQVSIRNETTEAIISGN